MIREKLQRKAVGVLLAGAILICVQPNVVHAENHLEYTEEMKVESVSPMYVQGNRRQVRLAFSGKTARCQAFIRGKSGR